MPDGDPRRFRVIRRVDISGVSGTGRVAYGVQFRDGVTVIHWDTKHTSTSVYQSIADVEAIHSHGGLTYIEWVDFD